VKRIAVLGPGLELGSDDRSVGFMRFVENGLPKGKGMAESLMSE
jgi:hypothetical protein